MSKMSDLETACQNALNAFIQDNNGRAPAFVEMNPTDWTALRDYIKNLREAEGFAMGAVDVAKTGGRENFRLFGLPIAVGAADLESPRAVANV